MGRVILAWSASTSLLAVASDNYVNLYRFPDPAVRFRWEIPTDGCSITRIALKRDGSEIAIGVSTGEIARRRVAEDRNEEVRCASSLSGGSTVQALSFSQAGELVSASPNGIAIDGRTISRLDATSLAFRPGGQILAAGTREGTIHLLDEEGKEVAASIRFGDEPVTGMAWSKNALAAVSRGLGLVRVWDDRGQEVLHQDSGLSGLVAVAVSTAGKNVAVSGLGEAQQTRVYRLQENDSPLVLLQPPANEAVLSDLLFLDENRLLIGDSKGAVRLAPLDSEGMRKSAKEFMAGHPCLKSAE